MNLFELGCFTSASGNSLPWKVECDSLTFNDWEWAAFVISQKISFSEVEGVPTGGLKLAEALKQYRIDNQGLLIVDDVLTTGKSMNIQRAGRIAKGAVLFARSSCPKWITPIWIYNEEDF